MKIVNAAANLEFFWLSASLRIGSYACNFRSVNSTFSLIALVSRSPGWLLAELTAGVSASVSDGI